MVKAAFAVLLLLASMTSARKIIITNDTPSILYLQYGGADKDLFDPQYSHVNPDYFIVTSIGGPSTYSGYIHICKDNYDCANTVDLYVDENGASVNSKDPYPNVQYQLHKNGDDYHLELF